MNVASRTLLFLSIAFCTLFQASLLADEGHHHSMTAEELGTVHFQNSCASKVTAEFDRGVALLHSFWYEEAEKTFRKVAADDHK